MEHSISSEQTLTTITLEQPRIFCAVQFLFFELPGTFYFIVEVIHDPEAIKGILFSLLKDETFFINVTQQNACVKKL